MVLEKIEIVLALTYRMETARVKPASQTSVHTGVSRLTFFSGEQPLILPDVWLNSFLS